MPYIICKTVIMGVHRIRLEDCTVVGRGRSVSLLKPDNLLIANNDNYSFAAAA